MVPRLGLYLPDHLSRGVPGPHNNWSTCRIFSFRVNQTTRKEARPADNIEKQCAPPGVQRTRRQTKLDPRREISDHGERPIAQIRDSPGESKQTLGTAAACGRNVQPRKSITPVPRNKINIQTTFVSRRARDMNEEAGGRGGGELLLPLPGNTTLTLAVLEGFLIESQGPG
ncbi:hypothetical protein DPEC_G00300110 [Dallia pectoralis]|uniref:Uncharacterized protein n=1 Tax=Dallia pectoralis TaxID=75939 RepID=A0ACC2FGE4_DALPE|nr:hypothetical protein DPEC_G00300110 [Dallia pectoralis]